MEKRIVWKNNFKDIVCIQNIDDKGANYQKDVLTFLENIFSFENVSNGFFSNCSRRVIFLCFHNQQSTLKSRTIGPFDSIWREMDNVC